MANIQFDDPENLADPSQIFLSVLQDLELLDYARRYFERKDDRSSILRAREIRKFYKQILQDYIYIVRSIVPEQIIKDYVKLFFDRLDQIDT